GSSWTRRRWPTRSATTGRTAISMTRTTARCWIGELALAHLAPKGRQKIAQGASPGCQAKRNGEAPKGRQKLSPLRGFVFVFGLTPRASALGYFLSPRWG